jgi:hypothetical protein
MHRFGTMLLIVVLAVSGSGCSSEEPPALLNGDFESGDFTGWSTQSWGHGQWLIYEDGATPPDPEITDRNMPFDMPDPPQGRFAAVTDMNFSSANLLYRDIEVTAPMTLHAIVYYENHGLKNHDPEDFGRFDGETWFTTERNQQFRVDLIDPEATVHSLDPDDVLATIVRTRTGDPYSTEPTPVMIDLTPWEGRTIRLRIVEIDNIEAFRAGIDDVRLEWAD